MNRKRRDFIKQSAYLGIGLSVGNLCLSCSRNRPSSKKTDLESDDFSMIAYCTLSCDQCDACIATQNNDEELKSRVAARWGMKPEDINCDGCKSENALFSCSAKKCATARNVITCAHCKDFLTCDNEFWENQPKIRENAEEMRRQLEAENKV